MARDSSGPKNEPQYAALGASADAADLTELGAYAALVGNRKVLTSAQRVALAGLDRWVGLEVLETDTEVRYRYTASGWKRVSELRAFASVKPGSVLTNVATDVAGLTISTAPVGVPCIVKVTLDAINGASGASRWFWVRVFDGATGLDEERQFALPLVVNNANQYTVNYPIPYTPTSTNLKMQLRADQNASVVLRQAALELLVAP